jgi:hypothetical protein
MDDNSTDDITNDDLVGKKIIVPEYPAPPVHSPDTVVRTDSPETLDEAADSGDDDIADIEVLNIPKNNEPTDELLDDNKDDEDEPA